MRKLEIAEKEQLEKNILAISKILNSSELKTLEELRKNFQETTQDIAIATELAERIHTANIKAQQFQDAINLIIDKTQYIIKESDAINVN